MLSTAIIGITGYGREHLRLLLHGFSKGLMCPSAAVVINPDMCLDRVEELRRMGCRIYSSAEAMWEKESGRIDLCMIPSSISSHYAFSRMALENGSHVFVEKPVCGTVQQVKELVAHSERLGLSICVGFQDLYSPRIVQLKRRVMEGQFGRLRLLKSWGSWPRPLSYYQRNNWAGCLKQGNEWVLDSPINNAMAHFLFMMLFWAGEQEGGFAEPVRLECDLFRAQAITSFDTATIRLATASGADIYYGVTHSGMTTREPVIRVEGDAGWFEWRHCGPIHLHGTQGKEVIPCPHINQIRENMIEEVVRWITEGAGRPVLARQAMLHTRIINALHDAAPIRDVPCNRLLKRSQKTDDFVYVEGLVEEIEQAYGSCSLLSELPGWEEIPSSVPFDLTHYEAFQGGYAEKALSPV